MSNVFLKVINLGIAGSWFICVVILLRLILKKAPRWVFCLLWGLVALRLLIPFSIESRISLVPSVQTISESSILSAAPEIETGIEPIDIALNPIISESLSPSPGDSVNPMQVWLFIGSILWILGIGILMLYGLISWFRICLRVRIRIPLRERIYFCDSIDTPFLLGFFRPKIYLPSGLPEHHWEPIIAHEQTHLKRLDHIWKPLGFLLLAIYWFHPLVWVAYILFCRDTESACDERVISALSRSGKADYSDALLCCNTHRRNYLVCPLAFGEIGVKERIAAILRYEKPALWVLAVAISTAMLAGVCFLTDPPNLTRETERIRRATAARELLITDGKVDYFRNNLPEYMLGCYIGKDFKLYFRMETGGEALEASLRQILNEYEDIIVFEYSDLTKFTMDTYAETIRIALANQGFDIKSVRVADRSGNITVTISEDENLRTVARAVKGLEKYTYGIDVKHYHALPKRTEREHDNNYMNSIRASERLMMYFYRNDYISDYPDYYAGSYIGDDNLYHIRINRRVKDGEDTVRSVLGGYSKYIVFEYTNYSYNELRQEYEDMSQKLRELGVINAGGGPREDTGDIEIGVFREDIHLVEYLLNSKFPYPFGHRKFSVIISEGSLMIME